MGGLGDSPFATSKGLSQNRNFKKYTFLKVINSVGNREIIAISAAKLLEWFSKKSILQQPPFHLLTSDANIFSLLWCSLRY